MRYFVRGARERDLDASRRPGERGAYDTPYRY